nr:MAG TPA: hypothetical protein [Microviridae sp.]
MHNCKNFKGLIIVVTSNWGQIYKLFSSNQKKTGFLDSTIF